MLCSIAWLKSRLSAYQALARRCNARLALGLTVAQFRFEHLREEGVVAVRVVASIEWDEERVRARKLAKHLRRTRSLEDGVADGAGERVEH